MDVTDGRHEQAAEDPLDSRSCSASIAGLRSPVFAWFEVLPRSSRTAVRRDAEERFKYGSIGGEQRGGNSVLDRSSCCRACSPKICRDRGGYASLGIRVGAGTRPAGRVHEEDHRLRARGQQLRGVPYRQLSHHGGRESRLRRSRSRRTPSNWRRSSASRRLRQGSALQPRHPDGRDRSGQAEGIAWIDEQIYRYLLIPLTRRALLEQEKKFAWIYVHHGPPQQTVRNGPNGGPAATTR